MKIVVLDGYAENPGDLSWDGLGRLGELTVYDRTSLTDEDEAIARTIRMVTEGKVTAITGEEVSIDAHSICVHGDNPSAVEFVKNIRARLEAEGVTIAPIADIV